MAENKTKPQPGDVDAFLAEVDPAKRDDSETLVSMMSEVSGEGPVLWGTMIGFGQYHYKYASGHEGDTFRIGFAPRKAELSLYVLGDEDDEQSALLNRLGKHRAGKSCLYVKKLAGIDMSVLRTLTERAYQRSANRDA